MTTLRSLVADDLRDVARHTKGAVHQLSDIKLDVLKAAPVLQGDPATSQAFQGVLAALDAVGTAISTDYDALVHEVVGLEPAAHRPAHDSSLSGGRRVAFDDVECGL